MRTLFVLQSFNSNDYYMDIFGYSDTLEEAKALLRKTIEADFEEYVEYWDRYADYFQEKTFDDFYNNQCILEENDESMQVAMDSGDYMVYYKISKLDINN